MNFQLKTVAVREDGVFGVLLHDGQPFAVTCEHTFEGMRTVLKNGVYVCTRDRYVKGGYETFEIQVEGHDRVLFHKGNVEADSRGCVLVAENFAILKGVTAVGDSKSGFEEFMVRAEGMDEFTLEVSGR